MDWDLDTLLDKSPFKERGRVEEAVVNALRAAASSPQRAVTAEPPAGAIDPSIRASFVRWILLEAIPASGLALAVFQLREMRMEGILDLKGTKTSLSPSFLNCHIPDGIDLTDAEIGGMAFVACTISGIRADRLKTTGTFSVRSVQPGDTAVAGAAILHDSIRLNGASIGGNLDFRGCQVLCAPPDEPERIAIFADGLTVAGNALLSDGFRSDGEVRLNGCKLSRNLDCSGSTLNNPGGFSLSAAGGKIEGSAYFCHTQHWRIYLTPRPFQSNGNLRLEGARIDGSLDCRGGEFRASCFCIEEKAWPNSRQPSAIAIDANGMNIGANLHLRGIKDDGGDIAFTAKGRVNLVAAKIGMGFICTIARFAWPSEMCLVADGISVDYGTFLGPELTVDGYMSFALAALKEGLYANDITFDCSQPHQFHYDRPGNSTLTELGPGCGIHAPLATVDGTFEWKDIKTIPCTDGQANVWLYLQGAKADTIEDEEESWERLSRFNVTGCTYSSISDLTGDIGWRLRELDRQYAILNPEPADTGWQHTRRSAGTLRRAFVRACRRISGPADDEADAGLHDAIERFSPQPYLQLAKIVRQSGYEDAAKRILVRLEDNKTVYGDVDLLNFLGRIVTGLVLQYGFAPFRPLRFLIFWLLLSTIVFEHAYYSHEIVPSPDNRATDSNSVHCSDRSQNPLHVCFNAFEFTLETLVPVIDLNQKKSWTVEPLSTYSPRSPFAPRQEWVDVLFAWLIQFPNRLASVFLFLNSFFGWALWGFAAAGVTGLLRSGGDGG
jgi:hypothetical protein